MPTITIHNFGPAFTVWRVQAHESRSFAIDDPNGPDDSEFLWKHRDGTEVSISESGQASYRATSDQPWGNLSSGQTIRIDEMTWQCGIENGKAFFTPVTAVQRGPSSPTPLAESLSRSPARSGKPAPQDDMFFPSRPLETETNGEQVPRGCFVDDQSSPSESAQVDKPIMLETTQRTDDRSSASPTLQKEEDVMKHD